MNLDELRSVQAKERRKDSLQHLRDDFYDDVAAYVADLRAARDGRAEQVAKPFSDDDVRRMSDELETAEEVGEALYERRVGKVVKLASFAAADMTVDTEGMTSQERALFDDLVERIEANKSRVLDALAGEEPIEPTSGTPLPDDPTSDAPAANAPADDGVEAPTPGSDPDANADVLAGAMGGDRDASPGPDGTDTRSGDPDDDPEAGVRSDSIPGDRSDPVPEDRSDPATTDGGAAPADHDSAPAERDPPFTPGIDADDPITDADNPVTDADNPVTDADDPITDADNPVTDAVGPAAGDPEPTDDGVSDELGDGADHDPDSTRRRNPEPDRNTTTTDTGGAKADGTKADGTKADGTKLDGTDERDAAIADAAIDRETVRITSDIGAILGVDEREYELASEDVVTLPAENAEPLVRRDAAERIE